MVLVTRLQTCALAILLFELAIASLDHAYLATAFDLVVSGKRRYPRCALVAEVQTFALPISWPCGTCAHRAMSLNFFSITLRMPSSAWAGSAHCSKGVIHGKPLLRRHGRSRAGACYSRHQRAVRCLRAGPKLSRHWSTLRRPDHRDP